MEEVDNIIIVTLRQIGCGVPDEVKFLGEFSTELIVEGVVRCLRAINEDVDLPLKLPESMSVRFRIGTALAEACKDIGYTGEIGYQTFLYSNVEGVRRLFMYLVEKLPREGAASADEPAGSIALLDRALSAELASQLQRRWTPPFCKQRGLARSAQDIFHWEGASGTNHFKVCPVHGPHGLADISLKTSKGLRQYYNNQLVWITAQPQPTYRVVGSLQEWNAKEATAAHEWETEWSSSGLRSGLSEQEYRQQKKDKLMKKLGDMLRSSVQQSTSTATRFGDLGDMLQSFVGKSGHQQTKGTRFTHAKDLQFTQVDEAAAEEVVHTDNAEDMMQRREDEIAALRARLEELTSQVDSMELDIKKFTTNLGRLAELTKAQQSENAEKEEEYNITKQVMELLPNAEENIQKLQEVIADSAQRLVKLAEQWESRRVPLVGQYRELKRLNASKMTETQKMLADINSMRAEMKTLAAEGRSKEDLQKQLLGEYERMSKDLSRSAYTRRIIEIINNIQKQKTEIGKVLSDTRTLQKEINMMTGQLDRTFAVTDELIFRDAKKDETCRTAYKLLASLHDNCAILVKAVEETGVTMREIRDLEDQLEKENKKKTASNLEQITADYEEMQRDNKALRAKVKGKA